MAITTRDGLVAAMAGAAAAGRVFTINKSSIANAAAGQLFSLWRAGGAFPAQGAIPGAAATCDNTLAGGFTFTSPGSGNLYLGKLDLQASLVQGIILYDRLAHMGGLSGTVTTAQTVSVSIPSSRLAQVTGSDTDWYLEWYTDTGATGVNATVSYTDQTDTAGRTVVIALSATTRASRLMQIVPNAGQYIKSVQSVTLSATTGTAGSFGVTAARRIAMINYPATTMIATLDAFQLGIPQVPTNACLWLVQLCSTTSTGIVTGRLDLING